MSFPKVPNDGFLLTRQDYFEHAEKISRSIDTSIAHLLGCAKTIANVPDQLKAVDEILGAADMLVGHLNQLKKLLNGDMELVVREHEAVVLGREIAAKRSRPGSGK